MSLAPESNAPRNTPDLDGVILSVLALGDFGREPIPQLRAGAAELDLAKAA
jgi:hypothetical protein